MKQHEDVEHHVSGHMDQELRDVGKAFATMKDFEVGNTRPFYIPYVDHPSFGFFPRERTRSIPLSNKVLSQLHRSSFPLDSDSPLAAAFKRALEFCEVQPPKGEVNVCATSLESLLEFASGAFGSEYTAGQTRILTSPPVPKSNRLPTVIQPALESAIQLEVNTGQGTKPNQALQLGAEARCYLLIEHVISPAALPRAPYGHGTQCPGQGIGPHVPAAMTDMVTTLWSVTTTLNGTVQCRGLLPETCEAANVYLQPLIHLLQSDAVKDAVSANYFRQDVQLAVDGLRGAATEVSTKIASMGQRSPFKQALKAVDDLQRLQSLLADLDHQTQQLLMVMGLQYSPAARDLAESLLTVQGTLNTLADRSQEFLQELQEEVAARRTAGGEAANTTSLSGAITPLVRMLDSPDSAVQREAASALGHLAADNAANKASIGSAGAIPRLVRMLDSPDVQCHAAWALGVLADGNAANEASIASAGAMHVLAAGIQADAARAVQAEDHLPPPLHNPRSVRQSRPTAPSTLRPAQPHALVGASARGASIADLAQSLLDAVGRWDEEHLRATRTDHQGVVKACMQTLQDALDGLWINPQQLELGDVVGQGGFAVVRHATLAAPGSQQVALKQFHVFTPSGRTRVQSFVKEVCLLSQLRHKNIVVMHHFTANVQCGWLGMVLEWAGDSLAAKLDEDKAGQAVISPQQRLAWAIGMAEGIQYLHGQNPCIVHRDLTSRNVLIDQHDQAKLIDLGISQLRIHTHLTVNRAGCHAWMAPELISGRHKAKGPQLFSLADETSDIYSFGLCLGAMATHSQPWEGCDGDIHVVSAFMEGARLDAPHVQQPWLQQLICQCMSEEPGSRPVIGDVLSVLRQHSAEGIKRSPGAWPVRWPDNSKDNN